MSHKFALWNDTRTIKYILVSIEYLYDYIFKYKNERIHQPEFQKSSRQKKTVFSFIYCIPEISTGLEPVLSYIENSFISQTIFHEYWNKNHNINTSFDNSQNWLKMFPFNLRGNLSIIRCDQLFSNIITVINLYSSFVWFVELCCYDAIVIVKKNDGFCAIF